MYQFTCSTSSTERCVRLSIVCCSLYFTDKGNGRDVAQTDIEIILLDIQFLDVFVKSHHDGITSTPPSSPCCCPLPSINDLE